MQNILNRVDAALDKIRHGEMLILTDHPDRENEADLIMAAEYITPEKMNFIIRNTSGIVCVSLEKQFLEKFNLNYMIPPHENTSARKTPFTYSVDAKNGITTGVSAADRVTTIQTLLSETATCHDITKPGHIFPLCACLGGVLERPGHTEGALDLVRLAALKPAAILCEVMNSDGTMARGESLTTFAKQHGLLQLSIDDLIAYRMYHETMIAEQTEANLPIEPYGNFTISIIKEKISGLEHVVLEKPKITSPSEYLVRIHSSCLTGDLFCSKRCDCHHQLHYALQRISLEGGLLIYLNQEGRGIGLFNKIKAYALQEKGFDTVEANEQLGLPIDARQYYLAANILRQKQINAIRLMTANPNKISALQNFGIQNITIEPMPNFANYDNRQYLEVKKAKLHQPLLCEKIL